MKLKTYAALAFMLLFVSFATASAQQQEQPDVYEMAEMEADRLQRLLDLEDWQTFYVDSTLKHDLPAMMAEIEGLRVAKVSNSSMYVTIQDKWLEHIDVTYKKIFNEKQWAAYMKSGAAKAQKARDRRKQKAEGR
ncbi:MAG: hypothetical protein IJ971_07130 [Bacteroidales bacterium]|nr:hypothetical protein [Bacteroidales bacterium]